VAFNHLCCNEIQQNISNAVRINIVSSILSLFEKLKDNNSKGKAIIYSSSTQELHGNEDDEKRNQNSELSYKLSPKFKSWVGFFSSLSSLLCFSHVKRLNFMNARQAFHQRVILTDPQTVLKLYRKTNLPDGWTCTDYSESRTSKEEISKCVLEKWQQHCS
jgi:hypothetical protein